MNTTTTSNGSQFASCYMQATASLLDALASGGVEGFQEAHRYALLAIDAAYCPLGDKDASVEWPLGHDLAATIEMAARRCGYYGLPASRARKQPTKGKP